MAKLTESPQQFIAFEIISMDKIDRQDLVDN